jgi:hypothetical protein
MATLEEHDAASQAWKKEEEEEFEVHSFSMVLLFRCGLHQYPCQLQLIMMVSYLVDDQRQERGSFDRFTSSGNITQTTAGRFEVDRTTAIY